MPDKFIIKYDSYAQQYVIRCYALDLTAFGATLDDAIENMIGLFKSLMLMTARGYLEKQKKGVKA